MGDTSKKENIKNIFDRMDYGEDEVKLDLAQQWLEQHTSFPYVGAIECKENFKTVTLNVNNKNIIFKVYENRGKLVKTKYDKLELYEKKKKLIEIIIETTDFICQLEVLIRGFKPKDTKKGIQTLIDAINFSTFSLPSETTESVNFFSCTSLLFFGLNIGNALGNIVNIFGDVKTFPIISFFIECAIKAGFNKECFALRTTENTENRSYSKVPIIVFNDADLDSACDISVDAAWSNQGIVEWSTNTIIIQEDIFDEFVSKLKEKLTKIKMGNAHNNQVDYAYPKLINDFAEKLKKLLLQAEKRGIESYKFDTKNKFCPTLFIGNKVHKTSVIETKNEMEIPTLTCVAFRTNKEAILIANTSKLLAASVFSENIGLANEISQKLEAETIWVNCYGLFSPGSNYFDKSDLTGCIDKCKYFKLTDPIDVFPKFSPVLKSAVKIQKEWAKLGYQERTVKLQKLAFDIYSNYLERDKINVWINHIIHTEKDVLCKHNTTILNNLEIKSYKVPLGIVLISEEIKQEKIIKLLLEGNVVITSNKNNLISHLIHLVIYVESFPPGLESITFNNFYHKLKNVWTPIGNTYV